MIITIFNNININIDENDVKTINKYGNGIVPFSYEVLLTNSGITPENCDNEFIRSQVIKLIKDEVNMLKILNPSWESEKL